VAKEDVAYFKERDDQEICRHLDACGGISAQKVDDGMIVFRLPKMEVVSLYTNQRYTFVCMVTYHFICTAESGFSCYLWLLRKECRRHNVQK